MTETDGPEVMTSEGGRPPVTLTVTGRSDNVPVELLDASSGPTASCLCLTDEPDVVEPWQQFFARAGVKLVSHVPASMAMAYSFVRHEASAFALAHVPNPADVGGGLSGLVPIRSVHFPPLVVMVDRAATAEERERFRLQGAAYIVEGPPSSSRDATVLRQLVNSGSWFKGTTDRIVVTDLLQVLAADRKSGMLTVSCAHGRDFHTFPWNSASQCAGGARNDCQGWYGRLYVIEGQLIHAETPSAEGVVALADMIEILSGTLRIHDIFLEPLAPNMSGSIPSSILNAVLLVDERRRERAIGITGDTDAAGPVAVPRPRILSAPSSTLRVPFPPQRSGTTQRARGTNRESIQPKRDDAMKDLEPLLSLAPGLYAAAKADKSGNVQELVGHMDGEGVCAVVAMCSAPLERISGLLGLGAPTSWGFVNKKLSLYVQRYNDGFVTLLGTVTKSPESTLKKLAKTLGDKK